MIELVSSFYICHVSHLKREEIREAGSVTHTFVYIPFIYILYIDTIYIYTMYIAYI